MENIIKNLHKIKPFLTEEQVDDLENSALLYRRHSRIYFKINTFNPDEKEIIVKVWQEKSPAENYLEKADLNERAKTLISRYFSDYTIHTHPIPFQEAPPEIVTTEWVQKQMLHHGIKANVMSRELGISKSEISLYLSGKNPLGGRSKAMFFYYFKTKELGN